MVLLSKQTKDIIMEKWKIMDKLGKAMDKLGELEDQTNAKAREVEVLKNKLYFTEEVLTIEQIGQELATHHQKYLSKKESRVK